MKTRIVSNANRRLARAMACAFALAAIVVLPGAAPLRAATNDLTSILQQGLFEEEANRNLDAAIVAYQALAAQFDKDRQVAATAIFRLGECYRKLGRTNEAGAQYQRIVREFSDQNTLATLSRQNLAGMGMAASPSAAAVSPSVAREQQKSLLQKEIQLAEQDLAEAQKRFETGVGPQAEVRNAEREVLRLRQQLAALDAGRPELLTLTSDSDALRAAEAEASSLKAQLNQLTNLSPSQCRIAVLQNFPNPVLTKLMQDLADAEQNLVRIGQNNTPDSPTYVTGRKLIDTINQQINQQVETVLSGLQIKANMAAETAEKLRAQAGRSSTSPTFGGTGSTTTDEEEQEIRRIQTMIRNSPDRINAPGGGPNGSTTPLVGAVQAGYLRVAAFLLDHGAEVNRKSGSDTPLHAAAHSGNKAMTEFLLNRGADVNARNGTGGTALHVAAELGFRAVAEVLLDHKAEVNARNSRQIGERTPLHVAASKGNVEMIKLLIEHDADVNARTTSGSTPLVDALSAGTLKPLVALLEAKADPNIADNSGRTPLYHAAVSYGNLEAVKALLAAKADPNKVDVEGRSSLSFVAAAGQLEIAKALLEAKADPNAGTLDLPLTSLIEAGHSDAAPRVLPRHETLQKVPLTELLLRSGADPNKSAKFQLKRSLTKESGQDDRGDVVSVSPIQLAVARGETEITKLLLDHKADVKALSVRGVPLLYQAVIDGNEEITEALLAHGADVNARGWSGNTPLHSAVWARDRSLVECLLDHKADANARDNGGRTPLDYAKEIARRPSESEMKRDEELAAMLRAHGALDELPDFSAIRVTRPGLSAPWVIFRQDTNGWNHYTLLETLYQVYARVSQLANSPSAQRDTTWVFPDLTRLIIHRPNQQIGGKEQQIRLNLLNATNGLDLAKDMPLRFGDVLEIPLREHALSEEKVGLTAAQLESIGAALKRRVQLSVRTEKRELMLQPYRTGFAYYLNNLYLGDALQTPEAQSLLLSSSDLSRVKVKRKGSAAGKPIEFLLNTIETRGLDNSLLLEDGDVIEVPEK